MSTTTVSLRTDKKTKEEATELFRELGMDMSTAINLFLRQSIVNNGLPFTPTRESRESVLARAEAESREGQQFLSVEELMEDLQDDAD